MKSDPKSWRTSSQSPEAKKLELMRRAKTNVESTHGLGGLPKEKGHRPKPVSLPKMPWDNREKQIAMVLDAARVGDCNTTRDLADVTGLSVAICSSYVSELIEQGLLRRVGRTMPNGAVDERGPPYQVFEVVRAVVGGSPK